MKNQRILIFQCLLFRNLKWIAGLVFFILFHLPYCNAQEYSIHGKIDSVWFKNVDWDSKPPSSNCAFPSVRNFRYLYEETKVIDIFNKEELVKTEKEDWTEEDEKNYDQKYNEEHKDELDEMLESEDWDQLLEDGNYEIDQLINSRWNSSTYTFCYNNCLIGDCYVYWEITEFKDELVEYKYQTGFSSLDELEGKDNSVEIDLDLIMHRRAWIYFKILCSCEDYYKEDYSEYVKVDDDPWVPISLTETRSKPGYPFVKKIPILPILAGVTGGSIATYLLVKDDESPVDCNITGNALVTNSDCGDSNGSIQAVISPTGDYDFQWSNGETSQSINGLSVGTYQLTVTDPSTGCTLTLNASIVENAPQFGLSFDSGNADCGASNGSAMVNVTPPGEYEYLWSNGLETNFIDNLSAGSYQVTVSIIGSECSKNSEVIVGENAPDFDANFTSTDADCGFENGSLSIEITPSESYNYSWSNGETTSQINEVPAGLYEVTVTDKGGCTKVFNSEIGENPARYIIDLSAVGGNCLGEGANILITVESTGSGPIQLIASGPGGTHNITLNPGLNNLNEFITVLPGDWILELSDQSIGDRCTESQNITVPDETILETLDDQYEMSSDEVLNENIITNDEGINLVVTDNTVPSKGTLTINPDGSISYIPDQDQSGTVSFVYTVTDACGNTGTANVEIIVRQAECQIEGEFKVVDANCGFANGSIESDFDPEGNFDFQWSNGNTTRNLLNVAADTYQLTITDNDIQCSDQFEITVEEVPNEFIIQTQAFADSCGATGYLEITLESPATNDLIGDLSGDQGSQNYQFIIGPNKIEDLIAGSYTLIVYDEDAGKSCGDTTQFVIADAVLNPEAVDDQYETPFETTFTDNVLTNDTGRQITLTNIINEQGGNATFQTNGNFDFTPDQGFSGLAGFEYIITDSCSNTAMAAVEITVLEDCLFTLEIYTTNATCGLFDGDITAVVNEPGNYEYVWDNGVTGPSLYDVGAGSYTLSVTDLDLNCVLEFFITLQEDPADYISDLVVTQPDCGTTGEISFNAYTPGIGPLFMQITHPNGSEQEFIDAGQINLSDYIDIVPGTYSVTLTDLYIGQSCTESFVATISMSSSGLNLALETVIPPSMPTASDGVIIVVLTSPGIVPYSIFLDGVLWGSSSSETMNITGLASNTYQVHVMDASGCISNILTVTVPSIMPLSYLKLGAGMGFSNMEAIEKSTTRNAIRPSLMGGVQFSMFKMRNELEFGINSINDKYNFIGQNHLSILETSYSRFRVSGQVGTMLSLESGDPNIYWSVRATTDYNLKKFGSIGLIARIYGDGYFTQSEIQFNYTYPLQRMISDKHFGLAKAPQVIDLIK